MINSLIVQLAEATGYSRGIPGYYFRYVGLNLDEEGNIVGTYDVLNAYPEPEETARRAKIIVGEFFYPVTEFFDLLGELPERIVNLFGEPAYLTMVNRWEEQDRRAALAAA